MNMNSENREGGDGGTSCDDSVSVSVVGGSGKTVKSKNNKGGGSSSSHRNHQSSSCAYYGGYECLDLCVTKERDFDNLVETLDELMSLHKEERRWMERSVLLFQYHWVDMGKTGFARDPISSGEWISLCNRLNTPLNKGDVKSLYKDMQNELRRACKELGTELEFLDTGLPPWAIAELLKDLYFQSATAMGLKYVKQDPTLRLWQEILESDPVPILNKDGSKNPLETKIIVHDQSSDSSATNMSISPVALLSFIRSQQKEFKATIEDASVLIRAIQAQKSFKDLASDVAVDDDDSNNDNDERCHIPVVTPNNN